MVGVFIIVLSCLLINVKSDTVLLTRQTQDCMYGNAIVRLNHEVANLTWNENLNNDAEDWAIRMALKGIMQPSGKFSRGENLFMTYGTSVKCANGLYSWHQQINNFDYDNPKWSTKNGCFIQQVYRKVRSSGYGMATYKNKIFMVGCYDYQIMTGDPLDKSHIPKPLHDLTKKDLVPAGGGHQSFIHVPISEKSQIWSDWVKTSSCSANCGSGSQTEERWCIHGDYLKDCVGERKRVVACKSMKGCNKEINDKEKVYRELLPLLKTSRKSKFIPL